MAGSITKRSSPWGSDIMEFLQTGLMHSNGERIPLAGLKLHAPIRRPGKIICIGLNYRDHATETGLDVPADPPLFCKFANSVTDPGAIVKVPPVVAEPRLRSGTRCCYWRDGARRLGCSRTRIRRGLRVAPTTSRRETFNSVLVSGPRGRLSISSFQWGQYWLTPDELTDPQKLSIRCWVNGELRQDGSTAEMIFGVAELIAYITRTTTLDPGDVLVTGTPAGVGMSSSPPRYLSEGDEVSVEIGSLGRLSNSFQLAIKALPLRRPPRTGDRYGRLPDGSEGCKQVRRPVSIRSVSSGRRSMRSRSEPACALQPAPAPTSGRGRHPGTAPFSGASRRGMRGMALASSSAPGSAG